MTSYEIVLLGDQDASVPAHTLYQPEGDALDGRVPTAVRAWLEAVGAARSERP
jgi:hypothetical protein